MRDRIAAMDIATFERPDVVPRHSFDAVYSINVLEHIENDVAVIEQLWEILRPGGRLLLYVPAFNIQFSANNRRVGHFRRYTRSALVEVMTAGGFQAIDTRYVDSLGFAAALLYRLFGDRDGGLHVGAVRAYDSLIFPMSRAIDTLTRSSIGKNLLLRAVKPGAGVASS